VSTLGRASVNQERSSKAIPRLKTARGVLSKDSSGSSKKSRSNGNVSEKLEELFVAEEGRNTSVYHLGCHQAQLSALF
jgi:hypothetical protein